MDEDYLRRESERLREKKKDLENRIRNSQRDLKAKDNDHYLLRLIEVDDKGISKITDDFRERYKGFGFYDAFNTYVTEMKDVVRITDNFGR